MPNTIWRLYDTHRYPTEGKSPFAQLDIEVLHKTQDLLGSMIHHPEALAFLHGEHLALSAFE